LKRLPSSAWQKTFRDFRDQLIAAPLKRNSDPLFPPIEFDFRDQLIAAPLKPRDSRGRHAGDHHISAIS